MTQRLTERKSERKTGRATQHPIQTIPAESIEKHGPPGAYDSHHPPSLELIDQCVHCGFCLPTCPTYLLWNEEMDSPRGRIYLMKMGAEGGVAPMDEKFVSHFDKCLGAWPA